MGLSIFSEAIQLRAIEARINQVHQTPNSGVGLSVPGRRDYLWVGDRSWHTVWPGQHPI